MTKTSSNEKTLCGTSVITDKYSKTITIGKDSGTTEIARDTPGTTSDFREPDLVIGDDSESYDSKPEYYNTILGFSSKEKMAEAFVADCNEMIASIGQYGGFYIGRYELSEAGVKKNKETLTNTYWYNSYKMCKNLNASNKVETRMIWGCQWNVACSFIANKGEKKA